MPLIGVADPLGGGDESLWENLHLFSIYGSPHGTDIVTVSSAGVDCCLPSAGSSSLPPRSPTPSLALAETAVSCCRDRARFRAVAAAEIKASLTLA